MTAARRHAAVAALSLAVMPAAGAAARTPTPATTDDAPAALAFLNAPAGDAPLLAPPRLLVGVGGSLRQAVVDTGSTGVVLSASAIPDIGRLTDAGPGMLTYSSSGRIMRGRWIVTALTIAGRGGQVVTRPIPILAVTAIDCTPNARRCTPEANPGHVAMLGIGFGRAHDHQPGAAPDRNPLLNIAAPAGLPHGYTITRHGISFGGGAEGFTLVRLNRDPTGRDWMAPPACIALDDGKPACGSVLVDTGIAGMFLTLPPDRLPMPDQTALPPATNVTIDLAPGATASALRYSVRAADPANPAAPSAITLSGIGRRPTFVNTGIRLLNRFDYRFDADAGTVGYRPVATR